MSADQSKHTPGPWSVDDDGDGRLLVNGQRGFICTLDQPPGPEQHANAALIAAAPDTLAALKEAIDLLEIAAKRQEPEWDGTATSTSVLGKARAAIRRAESASENLT